MSTTTRKQKGQKRSGKEALPPLSSSPNEHPGYARPNGVIGRMKPTKARKLLRQMDREHTAEEDRRIAEELDDLLSEGRA